MRSYETSRGVFAFAEFLAWSGIVLGGIFVLVGFSGFSSPNPYGFGGGFNPKIFFIIPGLVLLVYGLLSVVLVQTARASVDTAELTGQILRVARDQLEVSKQSLRQSEAVRKGFETLNLKEPEAPRVDFGDVVAKAKPARSGFSLAFGAADEHPAGTPAGEPETIEYAGKQIQVQGEQYLYAGLEFASLEKVEQYIDGFSSQEPPTPPLLDNTEHTEDTARVLDDPPSPAPDVVLQSEPDAPRVTEVAPAPQEPDAPTPATEPERNKPPISEGDVMEYAGRRIELRDGEYICDDRRFVSLDWAKRYADNPPPGARPLPGVTRDDPT